MSSSSSDSDVGAAYNRWIRSLRLQDLPQLTESPPNIPATTHQPTSVTTGPTPPKGWNDLPIELKGRIMQESFISNFTNKKHSTMSPADPQPDTTLTDVVEKHSRLWFEQKILPETVAIVIRIHACTRCDTPAARQYEDTFVMGTKQQQDLISRASSIILTLQCNWGTPLGNRTSRTTGTIYVPENRLNILALSQTVLAGRFLGRHVPEFCHKKLSIHCNPRSRIGTLLSIEVLKIFADLLLYLEKEHCTVTWDFGGREALECANHGQTKTFAGTSKDPIADAAHKAWFQGTIHDGNSQEIFTPTFNRVFKTASSWHALNPIHRALLAEFQTLFDTDAVAVHRVVEVSVAAFRNYTKRWKIREPQGQIFVPYPEMEDFTYSEIHGNCMLFLICHGLYDDMVRQFKEARGMRKQDQYPASLTDNLAGLTDIVAHLDRRVLRMTLLPHAQEEASHVRQWFYTDAPYLVHQCAMLQAYIRFRMMYIICYATFDGPQTWLQDTILSRTNLDRISKCLTALKNLSGIIASTRQKYAPPVLEEPSFFTGYDEYKIRIFVRKWTYTYNMYKSCRQSGNAAYWWTRLRLVRLMDTPVCLRIPVIHPEHWAYVRQTCDDLNGLGHWSWAPEEWRAVLGLS